MSFLFNLYNRFINSIYFIYNLYIWFDFLLPIYIKNYWKQQKLLNSLFYIISNFFYTIYNQSYKSIIFFFRFIFIFLFFKFLYYTRFGRVLIKISHDFFFLPQIRIYIYSLFYIFLFLLTLYIIWTSRELYIRLDTCKIIFEYYKFINFSKILYADYTPYNIFESDNKFIIGRRFFKLGLRYGINIHTPLATFQYINSYIYIYNAYFMMLLFFLTFIHVLKMLKHLFDDYLRDLDKEFILVYYYIFCFLCIFLFFTNIEQLLLYFINFYIAGNAFLLISVYLFILIFYGLLLIYTYFIINKNRKIVIINFIFYIIILGIVWFWYSLFSAYIADKLFEIYLYIKALLQGYTPQYLLFIENTPQKADAYLSPVNTKQREIFFKLLSNNR